MYNYLNKKKLLNLPLCFNERLSKELIEKLEKIICIKEKINFHQNPIEIKNQPKILFFSNFSQLGKNKIGFFILSNLIITNNLYFTKFNYYK